MDKKNYFVTGIPIEAKYKLIVISVLFLVLILNSVLPAFFETFDYGFNGGVSILLVSLIVLFSLGNTLTEGIVIGIVLIILVSNFWDYMIKDLSNLRNQFLIGSIIVLVVEMVLGKIGIMNLIHIIKKQLGVK